MISPVDTIIARLVVDLEAEEAVIAAAVAAKAIGDGSGYWKRAAGLRKRLAVALALREVVEAEDVL